MKKRVILSAGGTGGHLFPAQSLATALEEWDILFVAGGLSQSCYFDKEQFAFEQIECATFSFSKPTQIIKSCRTILRGIKQSQTILDKFAPDIVVGFGSFFTLPVLIAAYKEKIPIILHEQNTIPGKVNRLFSALAQTTTITFPMTRAFLKGKARKDAIEVLFPLRYKTMTSKADACAYFGLSPSKLTLLVFGGSKGAVHLNALFLDTLPYLPEIQVLHFTGSHKQTDRIQKQYEVLQIQACVKSFESNMDFAMQAADFAITRAGAATIAELIEYTLPALLIPYPFATANHQEKNGMHFVSIVKGGKMYQEKELDAPKLARAILQQLPLLAELKKNISDYKLQRQSLQLADVIRNYTHYTRLERS